MGQPLSLKEMRSRTIDKIAGYVRLERGDNFPTHNIFEVEHDPVPDGVFLADPAIPPWRYSKALMMQDIQPREPEHHHENINYFDDQELPLSMNEVEVPDSELVDFNDMYSSRSEEFKSLFYKSAASVGALSDAADYVEAALRSGLDIDVEMDEALAEAFVHITRLDAVAAMARTTALTQDQKDSFIEKITLLFADRTMLAISQHDTAAAQRRNLHTAAQARELYARVRATNSPRNPQNPHADHDPTQQGTFVPQHQTQLGVRGARR